MDVTQDATVKETTKPVGDKYAQDGNENVTACLVVQRGKWGAYIITPSMLEDKVAPVYISGYERAGLVKEAVREKCLEWKFDEFTDYGNFWQVVTQAGIEKPEVMPHRM